MSVREILEHFNKAHTTLKAAKQLYDASFYEDCASKAYYAVYNMAKAALLVHGVIAKSHSGFCVCLDNILLKQI